mmetsp:Transcript_79437/g.227981  ORF Transcript_79437/g.227981 Transcript_79437/m.227981 type:complete len:411 (+) Transcript_79437:64-1296(+)
MAAVGLVPGRIKTLLDKSPPFGFVTPESGGQDLYFNERLLGGGKTWEDLKRQVAEFAPGNAPALFTVDSSSGRPQAKGLIVLDRRQMDELDGDGDHRISAQEMAQFLAAHPELKASRRKDASLTKQEREFRHRADEFQKQKQQNEGNAQARDTLFKRQDAAEDALYAKRDAENAEAARLREEGDRLWNAGRKDEAKELHAKAKEHQAQARTCKQKAMELDWKNNEEMFDYVQTHEHPGRTRDGSWIDLHGLSADFAVNQTVEALKEATDRGIGKVEVITGAGHHSGKGGPVVKKRILEMLQARPAGLQGISFEMANDGAVFVTLALKRPLKRPAPAPAEEAGAASKRTARSRGQAALASMRDLLRPRPKPDPADKYVQAEQVQAKPSMMRSFLSWICPWRSSKEDVPLPK